MKRIITFYLFSCVFYSHAQFVNRQIDNIPEHFLAPLCEPAIIMNLRNTQQLVGCANENRIYYSHNGGFTWHIDSLTTPTGVGGDPSAVVDTAGNFYCFFLKGSTILCKKSTDAGISWNQRTYVDSVGWNDKPYSCIDWSNSPWRNSLYVTWTNITDSDVIFFSKSVDTNYTWSAPVRISHDATDRDSCFNGGAMPTVGPNGEVYAAWANTSIRFNKSLDGGNTWMSQETNVDGNFTEPLMGSIPGIWRPNAFPSIACDISNGPDRGNIYICWSDRRNGSGNSNLDIFMARSTDGGTTWNTNRVNNDLTLKEQFFPWMTVDQATGYIYIVFYDRRNYPDATTAVFLAWSADGGQNFSNAQISSYSFYPHFMAGDYIGITAYNDSIHPVWMINDVLDHYSIWTTTIKYSALATLGEQEFFSEENQDFVFPNPATNELLVQSSEPGDKAVIEIYNVLGEKCLTPALSKGEGVRVDVSSLPAGIYFLKVRGEKEERIAKFVKQ
jgi:hypothetical protein